MYSKKSVWRLSPRWSLAWPVLLTNAGIIIANTIANSFFGFLFWVTAARFYQTAQVGTGAAYIAAITLLASLSDMGLGITLIRYAPRMGANQQRFLGTCITTVIAVTALLLVLFLMGIEAWAPEFRMLSSSKGQIALFAVATLSFSLAQFLDKLYVAFEAPRFMFGRNMIAQILRLGMILILDRSAGAANMLLAIAASSVVTLALSWFHFAPRALPDFRLRLDWDRVMLWGKARYSLGNHFSQLLWNAPPLVFPLFITATLGPEANAHFYIGWMIANVLFIFPTGLSTALLARAANSGGPGGNRTWRVMWLALWGILPLTMFMLVASAWLLRIFGGSYAAGGQQLLSWLLISVLPYTVNTFVLADCRIQQRTRAIMFTAGFTMLACVTLIRVLGSLHGLAGIGMGWLAGQTMGAAAAVCWRRSTAKMHSRPPLTQKAGPLSRSL